MADELQPELTAASQEAPLPAGAVELTDEQLGLVTPNADPEATKQALKDAGVQVHEPNQTQ